MEIDHGGKEFMNYFIDEIKKINIEHLYIGIEYKEKFFNRKGYISTGSRELDNLLDYGIEPFRVYEFYGPAGTGKTIVLQQIVANSFIEYKNEYAYYLDGEGNFNPSLIINMLRYHENEKAMKQIIYARVRRKEHLEKLIKKIPEKKEEPSVVVIDGFTDIIRGNSFSKDPKLLHSYIRRILTEIHDLKEKMEIPIVISAKVYSVMHEIFSDSYAPYGGLAQKSMVNKLIHLTKEKNFFRAMDAYGLKPTAFFKITNEGIKDL